MSPWVVLLLIIVIILIVWWALLRNTHTEQADLHVHPAESHAEGDQVEQDFRRAAVHAGPAVLDAAPADEPPGVGELKGAPILADRPLVAAPVVAAVEPEIAPIPPVAPPAAPVVATVELENIPIPPVAPPAAPVVAAVEMPAAPAAVIEPPIVRVSSPHKPDDLIIIEGIGPKINQLMHTAGITTFAQLADTSIEALRAILQPAGLGFHDPTTWPQQARLAAEGKWDELKEYQGRLRGGRVV